MLRIVFFNFCLFYFIKDSCVEGHCGQINASDTGNPSFEVRGIFQPCVRELSGKDEGEVKGEGEKGNDLSMKCSQKIYVSLKITNQEPEKCHDHLILLDHVYDPLLNESSRLLNPVVIRVKQELIIKVYDLKLLQIIALKLVNAEPKEITKKQQSHSKKCKKPIACGSTPRRHRHPLSNGNCCSCDPKKNHHNAKCSKKSHVSCVHHQPGSLPYKDCVSKAHDSCLNDAHSLQESLNDSLPPTLGNYANDDVCHGKRVCHAKPRKVKDDGMTNSEKLPQKWRNDLYADEENHGADHGGLINSYIDDNETFTREKYFGGKYFEGSDKLALNTAGSLHESPVNHIEPGSIPVNSLESQEDLSISDQKNNMDGIQAKQSVEDEDYPSQDLKLAEEDEILKEEDDDEMINIELLGILENEASTGDSSPNVDRRQKRVYSYPEEYIEDENEFHSLRKKYHSGRRGLKDGGCFHGSSNVVIHCLKFSELWYEVYQLSNMAYKHVISLQVFEKKIDQRGSKVWVETNNEKPVRLSSTGGSSDDSYRYQVLEIQDEQTLLNPEIHRLLVPRMVEGLSKRKHPEATDNPAKFLILRQDLISANGSECDKAGVSAETFLNQKGRCTSKKGLCLRNQPSALWRSDKKFPKNKPLTHLEFRSKHTSEIIINFSSRPKSGPLPVHIRKSRKNVVARTTSLDIFVQYQNVGDHMPIMDQAIAVEKAKHNQEGQFFLKHYGTLSKNPYKVDEMSGNKTLSQDFNGTHVSQVDIIVPASSNHVVRKGLPAQITMVVTDATGPNHTIIMVSVINLGLASAQFTVQFGKCYPNVMKGDNSMNPSYSWSNDSTIDSNSSKMVVISPLHQFDFTINLRNQLPRQRISCIVQVLNDKMHLLAVRRVIIENGGRCICLWHCQCDCLKAMVNIKCKLMTLAEVKAAGLKGTIPALLPVKPDGYIIVLDDDNSSSRCALFFLFGVLLILLLLGLAKAILGVTFWRSIWAWGLPCYSGPKNLVQYCEAELKHREVKFDEEGYPVHPDSKKRTVQLYSRWIELLLNILIFIVLPILAIFWWPICWCCALCHRNIIGYRWIFTATKKSSSSSESTSEKSTAGSFPSSDLDDVVKSSSKGTSVPTSMSKTGSDVDSGNLSLSSKRKTKDQEERENNNISGAENIDAVTSEKNTLLRTSKHSLAKSQSSEDRSHPLPESGLLRVDSKNPMSMGQLPRYESRLSIEAYDGTADEQEANDVDYVLKQLHRSSTAIQKSQERIASLGGPLTNIVMSISARGEVVEDPEMSPRMETSSEDSVPGGFMMRKMTAEPKEKDLNLTDSAVDDQKPIHPLSNQVEHQSFEMCNVSSSQGLSGHLNDLQASMEYSFQNIQMGPVVREASEKSESALEDQTIGSFSVVTTRDSLEIDEEDEGAMSQEVAKALVEKLHAQKLVFRNIVHPIGDVEFPPNQPYSIRGYFLQTDGGYKFIPPTPLWQYWTLDGDGINMETLVPPKTLISVEFERDYPNIRSVAEAGDLSEFPLSTCINVQFQTFDSPLSVSSHGKPLQ